MCLMSEKESRAKNKCERKDNGTQVNITIIQSGHTLTVFTNSMQVCMCLLSMPVCVPVIMFVCMFIYIIPFGDVVERERVQRKE